MPIIALTDITVRNLKPTLGKQITYLDRKMKGFGIRVSPHGQMSYVLICGANRQRIKLGDVGIVKLAEARDKARTVLAERQLGIHQTSTAATYQTTVATFLDVCRKKRPWA